MDVRQAEELFFTAQAQIPITLQSNGDDLTVSGEFDLTASVGQLASSCIRRGSCSDVMTRVSVVETIFETSWKSSVRFPGQW